MCVKCGLLLEAATIPQWISQFWKSLLPPIGSRPAVGVRLSPEEDTEQDAVLHQVLWVALAVLVLANICCSCAQRSTCTLQSSAATGVVPLCCPVRSSRQGVLADCPVGRYSEHGTRLLKQEKGQNFTSLVAIEALSLKPPLVGGSRTQRSHRPFAPWQRRARSN